MIVMGRKTNIWNQRQGDGHYRCDLGFLRPENFAAAGGTIDLTNTESVKDLMLTDEYFGQHAPQIRSMIRSLEGPFRAWPLYFMPPEELNWRASSDVTLIGDAAHTVSQPVKLSSTGRLTRTFRLFLSLAKGQIAPCETQSPWQRT